jgi:hypothetical protein
MARYVITLSVDFDVAYDFKTAENQLNGELKDLLEDIRFQSFFLGGRVTNIGALKVTNNWEAN